MQEAGTYCDQIEANLCYFYLRVAELNGMQIRPVRSPIYVNNPSGGWPSYILGGIPPGDKASIIGNITAKMSAGELPAFWIIREPPDPESFYALLAESGIRPAARWTGMMLSPEEYMAAGPVEGRLRISRMSGEIQIIDWTRLINTEVFHREAAEPGIFSSLLGVSDFRLYAGWMDGQMVSTALAFLHEGVWGLYLISTGSEFRKRGIGRAVTSFAVEDILSENPARIVLHATRAGESVYRKMGFRDYCNFDILWKLDKS